MNQFNSKGRGAHLRIQGAKKGFLAIQILKTTGLRVGALPHLVIYNDNSFTAKTKGEKEVKGKLDSSIIKMIEDFKLSRVQPFKEYTGFSMWLHRANIEIWKKQRFSAHSFRHFFAKNLYEQTKNIYAIKQALGHSSVVVTESYLATLN